MVDSWFAGMLNYSLPGDTEKMHRKVTDEEDNYKHKHHQGGFIPFIFLGSGINAHGN